MRDEECVLRVERGQAEPDELAAIAAVLIARSRGAAEPGGDGRRTAPAGAQIGTGLLGPGELALTG
ncbi:acyl-CoA carboxylase epsilon subunit [Streptomyces sp. KL116D]|uniref:acyl-CoA carboxylase epsilon subunit n=1 Tax=Streptomyces sp. KL116D TaxID=3045152 RepID=UPI0035573A96